MNSDKFFCRNAEQLSDIKPSSKMLLNSLKRLIPNKNDHMSFIISIILSIILSIVICLHSNIIQLALPTFETILQIMIAIFGCIFTAFSIIIAVSNDAFLRLLSTSETKRNDSNKSNSQLVEYISYFESILYIYFFGLIVTGFIILFLKCIPNCFSLAINFYTKKLIAIILLSIYYTLAFRILLELKSTIGNTVGLFRLSLANKNLDFYEDSIGKETEETKHADK
jgi:predicted neutral ceramidase superfamily lipid hydrolase